MPLHPAYETLLAEMRAQDAPVIMFDGYSGAGYTDMAAVKAAMQAQILAFMARTVGVDATRRNTTPLYVVAGATSMGIGAVYDVARGLKERGFALRSVGIVCDKANRYPEDLAPDLDHYVDVPSPDGSWRVPMDDGNSYMVDVLLHARHAKAVFLGGGTVAKSELEEIERRLAAGNAVGEVEVEIRRGGKFAPDPAALAKIAAKAAAQNRTLDPYAFEGTKDYAEGVFRGVPPQRLEFGPASPMLRP